MFFFCVRYFVSCIVAYHALCLDMHMLASSLVYFGFTDSASRHTQNLDSATWVVYSPNDELVSSGGVCLGLAANNIS